LPNYNYKIMFDKVLYQSLLKKKNKMKKVLLIAAVAVLALSSCKKERTCTCTIDLGIPGVPPTVVSQTEKFK
jgi:hypothetical protein